MAAICGHCKGRNKSVAHVKNCFKKTVLPGTDTSLITESIEDIPVIKVERLDKPRRGHAIELVGFIGSGVSAYCCTCGLTLGRSRAIARDMMKFHRIDLTMAERNVNPKTPVAQRFRKYPPREPFTRSPQLRHDSEIFTEY